MKHKNNNPDLPDGDIPATIDLISARSNFRIFGTTEVFVDRSDSELIEISPETAAAKLVVDFDTLARRLDNNIGEVLIRQRKNVIDPVRKLITPLISGQSPYLEGTTTPAQMFFGMREWLYRDSPPASDPTDLMPCRVNVDGREIDLDIAALAAFLTLDVLLDGADLRQAMGRSVKLNMPQMFRCLCHLLLTFPLEDQYQTRQNHDNTGNQRERLSICLRQLHEDGFTRLEPDPDLPGGLH